MPFLENNNPYQITLALNALEFLHFPSIYPIPD